VKHATRPAIFKWRQTAPELILCVVRWYLRYSLSLRDVEELLAERGLEAEFLSGRPRIRDLEEKRLYTIPGVTVPTSLEPLVAGHINI